MRRHPSKDTAADPDDGDDTNESRGSGWTAGSHYTALATTGAIAAMVACGPIAIGLSLARDDNNAHAASTQDVDLGTAEQAAAEEFAERYVSTWLTTDVDNSDRLEDFVDPADNLTWPDEPVASASTPSTARIVHQSNGVWTVTVGVDVRDADQDTTYRRYFATSITYADGAMTALTLPSPVPGPGKAETPATAYSVELDLDTAAGKTISDFLNAALAGGGDLSRFTSPGTEVRAVSPTAYSAIEITDITTNADITADDSQPDDGSGVQALVTATAETRGGGSLPIEYVLTLRSRDGRWEVSAIEPAPQIETDSSDTAS